MLAARIPSSADLAMIIQSLPPLAAGYQMAAIALLLHLHRLEYAVASLQQPLAPSMSSSLSSRPVEAAELAAGGIK